jgi:hypothetical protein
VRRDVNQDYVNQALSLVGAQYRVPQQQQQVVVPQAGNGDYIRTVQDVIGQRNAEDDARRKASEQRSMGLLSAAASLYTGGAFGAVAGAASKGGIGSGGPTDFGKPKPADYSQYELGNRAGGPLFIGGGR